MIQCLGSPVITYGCSPGRTMPSARASRSIVLGLFSERCSAASRAFWRLEPADDRFLLRRPASAWRAATAPDVRRARPPRPAPPAARPGRRDPSARAPSAPVRRPGAAGAARAPAPEACVVLRRLRIARMAFRSPFVRRRALLPAARRRPAPATLRPECPAARVLRVGSQRLLDPQQLVVLRHPVGP